MNARKRSEAIEGLENLSFIIVVHMVLIKNFQDDFAFDHWNGELDGFIKTLRRYDKARKRKHNFSVELINSILIELIEDEKICDDIEDYIAAKNLPTNELNFDIYKQIDLFSRSVLRG